MLHLGTFFGLLRLAECTVMNACPAKVLKTRDSPAIFRACSERHQLNENQE